MHFFSLSILQIGGTAKSLAGGVTELDTALGILANNGIKGAEGGTHLRNIILALQNPTDKAAAQMEALGISVYDSEGNMRSLNDILGDLNTSMDGMTSAEKSNIVGKIFNILFAPIRVLTIIRTRFAGINVSTIYFLNVQINQLLYYKLKYHPKF